jgi:hypothetical protein
VIQVDRATLPVDVRGDVSVQTPSGNVNLAARGSTVLVSFSRFRQAVDAFSGALRLSRPQRHYHLTQLRRGLTTSGIRLSLRIDRWEIARIGSGIRTGLVARGLSLPGVRFRVGPLLAALVTRP